MIVAGPDEFLEEFLGNGVSGLVVAGVRVEHFATAFTEHFPVVHAARHYFGMPVVADLRVVAQHADLPAHGEHRLMLVIFIVGIVVKLLGLGNAMRSLRQRAGSCLRTRRPSPPPAPAGASVEV